MSVPSNTAISAGAKLVLTFKKPSTPQKLSGDDRRTARSAFLLTDAESPSKGSTLRVMCCQSPLSTAGVLCLEANYEQVSASKCHYCLDLLETASKCVDLQWNERCQTHGQGSVSYLPSMREQGPYSPCVDTFSFQRGQHGITADRSDFNSKFKVWKQYLIPPRHSTCVQTPASNIQYSVFVIYTSVSFPNVLWAMLYIHFQPQHLCLTASRHRERDCQLF